jgi:hypothetical protein
MRSKLHTLRGFRVIFGMAKSIVLRMTGALAVVLLFFFGTLSGLDYYSQPSANNRLRASHIKLLSAALEKYHQARGRYPDFPGNPVDDLKNDLVGGGFLDSIPSDPAKSSTGQQYRFVGSINIYGLYVILEPHPSLLGTKSAFACEVGVNIRGSGAWGDPPECPF